MTESTTQASHRRNRQPKNSSPRTAPVSGKNIILCSDGTGNRGGKGNGTNVWRIFNYIDLNSHKDDSSRRKQISFYEDGVGTEDFKLLKIFGGAFGWGLSRNIQELYDSLIKNYEEGDHIYLFGFSRGAFTVRSLAGLIEQCGIPDSKDDPENPDKKVLNSRELKKKVKTAYQIYKSTRKRKRFSILRNRIKFVDTAFNVLPKAYGSKSYDQTIKGYETKAARFKADNSIKNIDIHFIGVWDTVSAIGMPFDFLRWLLDWIFNINFHNYQIGPSVKYGYHGLSIDDERHTFHPQLWDETVKTSATLEQVWFSGVHSNVGGGYPKRGMAHVPLYWMMSKATNCGLMFKKGAMKVVRDAVDVSDKMYDSRSGAGIYYRYLPRNIEQICDKNGLKEIKVHASVFERIDFGIQNYAPVMLPTDITIVTTGNNAYPPQHSENQIQAYQSFVNERARMRESVLKKIIPLINMRRTLYFIFLGFNALLITELVLFTIAHNSMLEVERAAAIIHVGVLSSTLNWLSGGVEVLMTNLTTKPIWAISIVSAPIAMLAAHKLLKDRMDKILTGYWWSGLNQPTIAAEAKQPRVYRTGSESPSTANSNVTIDDPADQPVDRTDP
ncbi:MAG: DUF2235 domain-containing protein [Acidiferrobacterales bacterium]